MRREDKIAAIIVGTLFASALILAHAKQANAWSIKVGSVKIGHASLTERLGSNGFKVNPCIGSTVAYCPTQSGIPVGPQSDGSINLSPQEWKCKVLQLRYVARHGMIKPAALKPYSECRLWQLDNAWHTTFDNPISLGPLSIRLEELSEIL